MGIGGNGGLTPILQHKTKPNSGLRVDLILQQNPVNSNFLILKASAVGQTNKASLPLRQCLNVNCHFISALSMRKIIRILAILFCISAGLWAGRLSITRAIVSKSDLRIVEGKVVGKRVYYSPSGRTNQDRAYHIEFELEEKHERIAINFPTNRQAYHDSIIYKVDTGKIYKFYLDKSYPTFLNKTAESPYYLNKGIDIIEDSGGEIFSKSHNFELGAGIFFVLLSAGLTFVAIKYGKWKNGS